MADYEVEEPDWEAETTVAEFPTGWEDDGGWEGLGSDEGAGHSNHSDIESDGFGPSLAAPATLTNQAEPPAKKLRPSMPETDQLNAGWESLLNAASSSATQGRMQMPWERGFAARVFSNQPFALHSVISNPLPAQSAFPIPHKPEPTAVPAVSISVMDRLDKVGGAWPVVAGRMSGMNWDDKKAASRTTATNAPFLPYKS